MMLFPIYQNLNRDIVFLFLCQEQFPLQTGSAPFQELKKKRKPKHAPQIRRTEMKMGKGTKN